MLTLVPFCSFTRLWWYGLNWRYHGYSRMLLTSPCSRLRDKSNKKQNRNWKHTNECAARDWQVTWDKTKKGAGQMEKVPRKGLHVARPLPSATDRERSACSTRSDVNRQHHKSRVAKNLRIRPVKAAYETSALSKHRPLSRLCQPIPGQGITSWATTVWST